MNIRTIFEDNINEYSDLVDRDVAENMGRMYYRGIAAHSPEDNRLLSLLIWELKSVESSHDTESDIKWIYAVEPSYLEELLADYHMEAIYEDVKRTTFESAAPEDDNTLALGKCGFSLSRTESRDIDVTVKECLELSIAKKKAPHYVQSIVFLDNNEFYQGLMNILFRYDDPALEDLAYLPKDWYEQSVSCYTKTDGKVTGLLLLHVRPSGILVPVLFFAVGADSRMNLIEMLRFSIRKAADIYPENTVIRVHRRNREVTALSGKLFPGKKGEAAISGTRTEAK
jgi:hypothetical protein